jgi:Heterokaryon incompatibility protein (HET)
LNGDEMPVRSFLHESLTWLRYHQCFDPIWIDALCIDQVDYEERSAQVQIMGEIYKFAAETVIYIPVGPKSREYHAAIERELKTMEIFNDDTPVDDRPIRMAILAWVTSTKSSLLFDALLEILRDDTLHTYWRRVWTVQECFFARSLRIVHGSIGLSWSRLNRLRYVAALMDVDLDYATQQWTDEQREKLDKLRSHPMSSREAMRQRTTKPRLEEIIGSVCSQSACTDQRDYIFGVLAMVESSQQRDYGLQADYRLCTSCVWRNATACIIKKTQRLDILGYCGVYSDTNPKVRRLSWVPTYGVIPPWIDRQDPFRFTSGSDADWALARDSGPLEASGFVMGKVGALHKVGDIPSPDQVQRVLQQQKKFVQKTFAGETYRKQWFDDLVTLVIEVFDTLSPDDNEAAAVRRVCAAYGSTTENLEKDSAETFSAFGYIRVCVDMSILFPVTRDSDRPLLGVGYSDHLRRGDLVCGILGCNAPLVVRRGPKGDQIIGFCLVAGYSNGQAMEELQAGKLASERFTFI